MFSFYVATFGALLGGNSDQQEITLPYTNPRFIDLLLPGYAATVLSVKYGQNN